MPSFAAGFEVVAVGMHCPEEPEGARMEAPGTELGWIREGRPLRPYDVLGTDIPADHLLSFGITFAVPEEFEVSQGVMVLEHPPMGVAGVTRQTHSVDLVPGQIQGTSWIFEFDYERVHGTWTRSLEVDGETMWSVTFQVGPPGSHPLVNEICFDAMPMS